MFMETILVAESSTFWMKILGSLLYGIALLIVFSDILSLIKYQKVRGKIVGVTSQEELHHDMAGASHTVQVPEVEFRTKDQQVVRMNIYESLLKSLRPGDNLWIYYRYHQERKEYRIAFPFSRAKILLLLLFLIPAFMLWLAA